MKIIAILVLTVGVVTAVPERAEAQQSFIKDNVVKMIKKAGVHLNASYRQPIDDPDVQKGASFVPSIGLAPGTTNGWKYPVSLSIFRQNLHGTNGQQFAILRSFTVQAGIGYGWHFGRYSTGVQLQVGWANDSINPSGDMPGAFDLPAGSAVSMHVSDAVLLRPQIKAEYLITPKFTFRVSADYVWLEPDLTVTTPAGTLSNWKASNMHGNIGFGYYPFRK